MSRIVVLGSGAWGTAIALSLVRRGGHQITLWAHSPELASQIISAGENSQFLPGFPIPFGLAVTADSAASLPRTSWSPLSLPSFCARLSFASAPICTTASSSSAPPKALKTTPSSA